MNERPSRTDILSALRDMAVKGGIVLLIALLCVFVLNAMMQNFLDREVAQMQEIAKRTADALAAIENAEDEEEIRKLKHEAMLLKLEQMEAFYQQYKTRWSYHDYGQFYEIFEQVYSVDTMVIGTSHATHGLNPKYLDEENPDYSFYNFALNGSNPTYYYNWYDIAFNEANYPQPKTLIFCVDWFMFDDGWLWRNIFYDTTPDKPVDIMRKLQTSKPVTSTSKTNTGISDLISNAINSTISGEDEADTETKKDIPFWDISAHLDETFTVLFNQIPIVYSRDRIFEMLGSYFSSPDKNDTAETAAAETTAAEITDGVTESGKDAPEKEYILPVYEHEYLIDGSGFVTSKFYKGFIPWEAWYGGDVGGAWANDNPSQKNDFIRLIKMFQASGVNIVFVMLPEYLQGRNAPQFDEKLAYLTETAEKYNIPFLNYNEPEYKKLNGTLEYYSDWGHLNEKGATAFSKQLAKDIGEYLHEVE